MMEFRRYWDEERETLDSERRNALILARIREQLQFVYLNIPFYRNFYDRHGFHPEQVQSLQNFTSMVPVVRKADLRQDQAAQPPFGSYLGIEPGQVVRIHGSSGTTGRPTIYGISREDWERGNEVNAMCLWAAGLRPDDLLHIAYPFGLFFGGWAIAAAAERLGCTILPLGASESERHIHFMQMMGSTAFTATPSYALHLAEVAAGMGVDLNSMPVRLVLSGSEPGSAIPATKRQITDAWGARVHDLGTTSEMFPFLTNMECDYLTGMHCWIDEVYTEIVDTDNPNVPRPMGERGVLVYTHLYRRSQPMIRFWSGDESLMTDEPCPCGRTYPRLPQGIFGRVDEMLKVRGANIYPTAVEDLLRTTPGLGHRCRVVLRRIRHLDEAHVEIECEPALWRELAEPLRRAKLEAIAQAAGTRLRAGLGIRFPVVIVPPGALMSPSMKAVRVLDLRGQPGGESYSPPPGSVTAS